VRGERKYVLPGPRNRTSFCVRRDLSGLKIKVIVCHSGYGKRYSLIEKDKVDCRTTQSEEALTSPMVIKVADVSD